jgi:hypothetical protein
MTHRKSVVDSVRASAIGDVVSAGTNRTLRGYHKGSSSLLTVFRLNREWKLRVQLQFEAEKLAATSISAPTPTHPPSGQHFQGCPKRR